MCFYEVIGISILFIYVLLIFSYTYGIIHIQSFNSSNIIQNNGAVKISVLIPFKNEKNNLKALISGLKKQTIPDNLFEIIFINDHSDDGSEQDLLNLISDIENFNILNLKKGETGKKEALKAALKSSKYNLIVTSDADCIHSEKWLQTIYNYYSEFKPKMIIAPVKMTGNGFFSKLQILDFSGLTASTLGATGIGHPIMCNGANLIYEKSVITGLEDPLKMNEKSGDDVFLLHAVKHKFRKKIHYLKSNDATVYTRTEDTFKLFLKQRIRWASKSKSYKDSDTVLVSLLVFTTNFLLIFAAFASIFQVIKPESFFLLFFIKLAADTILLVTSNLYFNQKKILFFIPFLSILHPFYIVFTAIAGLIAGKKKFSNV